MLATDPVHPINMFFCFISCDILFDIVCFFFHLRNYKLTTTCTLLNRLLLLESQLFPRFLGHQIIFHSARQIILRLFPALAIVVLVLPQAHEILQHELLAVAFVIQREAAFIWRGKLQSFLIE